MGREEICKMIGCGKDKATKLLRELDTATGIGLIRRVRLGLGKSDKIYVYDIERVISGNSADNIEEENEITAERGIEKTSSKKRINRLQESGGF